MKTFTVYFDNCECEVRDCADAMEATQHAVETFYGARDGALTMFPDSASERPRCSTLLIVHQSGDYDGAFLVQTDVCLAKSGFYREANAMKAILEEQLKKVNSESLN